MDRVYGVMLIGCGHIGEEHLADIYYRDNVRIEAVVDQQPERAALFARKYGAGTAAPITGRFWIARRSIS